MKFCAVHDNANIDNKISRDENDKASSNKNHKDPPEEPEVLLES